MVKLLLKKGSLKNKKVNSNVTQADTNNQAISPTNILIFIFNINGIKHN